MLAATFICGLADEVGDAVQAFIDAGLDGLIFNMPARLHARGGRARRTDADRAVRRVILRLIL